MDLLENIIQKWYEKNVDDISYDTRLLYLIKLFEELKRAGMKTSDKTAVGQKVLYLLDEDFMDESLHMMNQKMCASEINYAYRRVIIEVDEIEDEVASVEAVKTIDDGDIYQNTEEPDIDLRGVDLGEITFDEEFIKDLGIK